MDRRDTIKALLLGSVVTGLTFSGCQTDHTLKSLPEFEYTPGVGRTPEELKRDKKLATDESFFNEHELNTIAVLCDIILPENPEFGSKIDAGLVEFIKFMVLDMENHQLPLRGGLMWLDSYCIKLYDKEFVSCNNEEQFVICDQIAYPNKTIEVLKAGEEFFSLMRNLTLTGYFTSKIGVEELGYKGNTPNVWDGIPEAVLKNYDVAYEEAWLAKCVDQSKRGDIAQWDEEGNLIT
jgi:hypothetical protein